MHHDRIAMYKVDLSAKSRCVGPTLIHSTLTTPQQAHTVTRLKGGLRVFVQVNWWRIVEYVINIGLLTVPFIMSAKVDPLGLSSRDSR